MTRKMVKLAPVTRVSGPLAVKARFYNNQLNDVKVSGTMLRGFEWIMKDRELRDAVYLTQRVCGICSLAHGSAATYLLDDLFGLEISEQAQLIRNIMFGADLLQNHLRHYYGMVLPDYVKMPPHPPFQGQATRDLRLPFHYNEQLVQHYFDGIKMSQTCHQVLALFGGKAPHQHAFIFGGVTVAPTSDIINSAMAMIRQIKKFIDEIVSFDQAVIERYYSDYFNIGMTPGRFLSFGMFRFGKHNEQLFWPGGVFSLKSKEKPNAYKITEDLTYSWYSDARPDPHKPEAYSYVKAVHYDGDFYEVGSLARMTILGFYDGGSAVLDRIRARVCECIQVVELMEEWIGLIKPATSPYLAQTGPIIKNESLVVTDVMRGPLLHQIKLQGNQIDQYNLITPTQWNFSPQDHLGRPGPVAQAIDGTKAVTESQAYFIMGRIIRSFDPCMACATHLWQQ